MLAVCFVGWIEQDNWNSYIIFQQTYLFCWKRANGVIRGGKLHFSK